jgi:ketosteroid isomerase-like protein
MNREKYNNYLASFDAGDYDAVLQFWTPEFKVILQGEVLFDSPDSLKKTYGFLQQYVSEEIIVQHYLHDDERVFMEAIVRIRAHNTMTAEAIASAGLKGIMPITAGEAYDIPQFIHYHLQDGKFRLGTCLLSGPVTPVTE